MYPIVEAQKSVINYLPKYTYHLHYYFCISGILGLASMLKPIYEIVGLFNYKNVTLLLYRNIFTNVVYLDQLLGACQVCILTGSWVPL